MQIRKDVIGDTSELTELAQDTTTALANLATSNTTDRNTFDELRKTIFNQSSQITTLTNKLIAANEVAAKLKP